VRAERTERTAHWRNSHTRNSFSLRGEVTSEPRSSADFAGELPVLMRITAASPPSQVGFPSRGATRTVQHLSSWGGATVASARCQELVCPQGENAGLTSLPNRPC
jgi:hypothetical protein